MQGLRKLVWALAILILPMVGAGVLYGSSGPIEVALGIFLILCSFGLIATTNVGSRASHCGDDDCRDRRRHRVRVNGARRGWLAHVDPCRCLGDRSLRLSLRPPPCA